MYIYFLILEVIISTWLRISNPLGKTWLCKEYVCNLKDTFRLIGCAIAITS